MSVTSKYQVSEKMIIILSPFVFTQWIGSCWCDTSSGTLVALARKLCPAAVTGRFSMSVSYNSRFSLRLPMLI